MIYYYKEDIIRSRKYNEKFMKGCSESHSSNLRIMFTKNLENASTLKQLNLGVPKMR